MYLNKAPFQGAHMVQVLQCTTLIQAKKIAELVYPSASKQTSCCLLQSCPFPNACQHRDMTGLPQGDVIGWIVCLL